MVSIASVTLARHAITAGARERKERREGREMVMAHPGEKWVGIPWEEKGNNLAEKCCLIKFLKTLMLTLENIWNNMLL